jgi:hypothetical protein
VRSLRRPWGRKFSKEPLTLKEVEEAIDQAQNNEAPGQDTMFNELIKYGGEQAAQSCFFLFTQLFENGISPSSWSKALIHLIFKGGNKDRLSCSSYRPISLISIVFKIYERVSFESCRRYLRGRRGTSTR